MDEFLKRAAEPWRGVVCPVCECGELVDDASGGLVRCSACACALGAAVRETIIEIASLPDAAGRHPCECGHPEMLAIPGGVFHCPACRSEVLPPASPKMPA